MRFLALFLVTLLLTPSLPAQNVDANGAEAVLERAETMLDRHGVGEDITVREWAELRNSLGVVITEGSRAQANRAKVLRFLSAEQLGGEEEGASASSGDPGNDTGLRLATGATLFSLAAFNGALFFEGTTDTLAYTTLGISLGSAGVATALLFRDRSKAEDEIVSAPVSAFASGDQYLLREMREDLTRRLHYAEEAGTRLRTISLVSYGVSAASFVGLVVALIVGNEAWNRYNDAAFSSDATDLRRDVERYDRASVAFGSIAVLSAGIGTMTLFARPSRNRIQERIDEIDRLLLEVDDVEDLRPGIRGE